jgi:hypothetical protein
MHTAQLATLRIRKPCGKGIAEKVGCGGWILNHRPLGYESKNTIVFNNLQDAGGPRKAL